MPTPLILCRAIVDDPQKTPPQLIARIPGIPARGYGEKAEAAVQDLQQQLAIMIRREGLSKVHGMIRDTLSVTHSMDWDLADLTHVA